MAAPSFVATANAAVGSGTSITVDKPTGTTTNDLLLAFLAFLDTRTLSITPADWQALSGFPIVNAGIKNYIFYKIAGASEPANYTWEVSGTSSILGQISDYRSVEKLAPFDVIGGSATGSDDTAEAPAVTTTSSDCLVVGFYIDNAGVATWTAPGGMAERSDVEAIEWVDQSFASPGSTGTKTATASVAASWLAFLIGLRASQNLTPMLGRRYFGIRR